MNQTIHPKGEQALELIKKCKDKLFAEKGLIIHQNPITKNWWAEIIIDIPEEMI